MHGLLICGGFSFCGAGALGHVGFNSFSSQALEHRLNSYGTWALLLRGTWDLPRLGIEPMSSTMAGGISKEAQTSLRNLGLTRAVLVTQLCPTVCEPMGYSLPGSSVHGILQARILEWVTMLFSRASS